VSNDVRHEGTKSWWSGTVRTLCGLTIENPEWSWWSPNCPDCKRAKREARRR
jgi:hypothetical protein